MKDGDIVYCIDKTSKYPNTTSDSINKLEFDFPYTIYSSDCGSNDIELIQIPHTFYMKTRFISKYDYIISKRKKIIHKLLKC